jgi:hypothetical protein
MGSEIMSENHVHDVLVVDAATPEEDHKDVLSTTDKETSVMIAEATAAAIEAVDISVDISAAADVAALALEATTNASVSTDNKDELDEIHAKKNEQRRKRYREKSLDPQETDKSSVDGSKKGKKSMSHEEQLAARRLKDRQRYAGMSEEQRMAYNAKRREQYHRQNEISRNRRRERERNRYHSLAEEEAKARNERRAKLERERYQRLTPEELEAKNRKRRERALLARSKKDSEKNVATAVASEAADVVRAVQTAASVANTKENEISVHSHESNVGNGVAVPNVDTEAPICV